MKYRFLVLASLLAAFFACSCTKEQSGEEKSSEEKVAYNIISTSTIADLDTFVKEKSSGGSYYAALMKVGSIGNLVDSKFPVKDQPLRTIRYTYKSVDPQGEPTSESAFIAMPSQVFEGSSAKGIILYNHPTYMSESECPYNSDIFETILAWMNYVLVVPDYYGFGASSMNPQAYLNTEVAARGAIDAYKAAVQILKDEGASYGDKLYNAGYSQGGFNSMANEKYVSENPDCGVSFTKTFAGGGSYDVQGTYDDFLSGLYGNGSVFAVASAISFNECEKLGLPYSSILQEPLLSNYKDWVLSKKYSSTQIIEKMGTTDITKLLVPDIIAKNGDAFNAIWKVCSKFSLVEGDWSPAKGSDIYVYHSTADDVVPYSNLTALKKYLSSKGGSVTYKDLQDVKIPSDVALILSLLGKTEITHSMGAIYFLYDIIANQLDI